MTFFKRRFEIKYKLIKIKLVIKLNLNPFSFILRLLPEHL